MLRGFWLASLLLVLAILFTFTASAQAQDAPAANAPSFHFENDILPVLTKYGCNSGGCHGKATGQNGFKLSLYAFDPISDYARLVHEGSGRRVTPESPEDSLMLTKATGEVAHGGGVRFESNSPAYRLLRDWIAAGASWGSDNAPRPASLTIEPAETIAQAEQTTPLAITVHYSDGTSRDVTATALYESQNPELLSVDEAGRVTMNAIRGEGSVMVRYQGQVGVARFLIPYQTNLPDAAYAAFQPKNLVDELALAKWKKLGLVPSDEASDETFLRRATLDTNGRLPTPDEVREFVNDNSPNKRDELIDRLLERPEFGYVWALRWGDWLRNKQGDGNEQKPHSIAFSKWIREAMQNNMPYDQFARALLTVTGKLEDRPEMDWYRQITNNQLRVEDTAQVFLGLRVACANCHNHPFESISQRDYWQFAGFFARVDAMSYGTIKTVGVKKSGTVSHPRTGEELKPKAFGGPELDYSEGADPRQQLADWLTAPDNPYFAKAVVNRVWGHYLAVGLVDAVDDMRATNPASNPELLDALARDFIDHKFDLKHLMRTILTSRVYGLSSQANESNAADHRNYARHYPRRLSPYVLLDAIADATGVPQKFEYFPDAKRAIEIPNERERSEFLDMFGRTRRETPCECETKIEPSLGQVLHFMFSKDLHDKIANPSGTLLKLIQSAGSDDELVEELYLRVLSRRPIPAEREAAHEFLQQASDARSRQLVLEDLMWTLLNSKEFWFDF